MSKIKEIREGLKNKEYSAEELVRDYLGRIESAAPLNAWVEICAEHALAQARKSDKRIQQGKARPLEGIPLGVKDMYCTKNIRTSAGSKMLENFIPPYESTVTSNLWNEGAVMLGKLNTDEFAMGSSNETSFWGPVINPWKVEGDDTPLVPGGSSGGPAAAVAADCCAAALGTDTGGSVRQPAALTGTVGLRPTYGRCSRWGIVAFASSLDQAGPITHTVEDAAILLNFMAGHDPKDSTSFQDMKPDFHYTHNLKDYRALLTRREQRERGRLIIGIPKEYHCDHPDIQSLMKQSARWLEAAGAELIEVSLPMTKYALPAYYIIAPAEASSNLARYDGVRYGFRQSADSLNAMYAETRAKGFGDEVKRRVLIGTYALSAGYYDAYYMKALQVRKLIRDDFDKVLQQVDLLLTPTTPSDAFALGSQPTPLDMYLNDVFTVPSSLANLPSISLPVGLSSRCLPLAVQLTAQSFQEDLLLAVAWQLEQAAGFSAQPERWWDK